MQWWFWVLIGLTILVLLILIVGTLLLTAERRENRYLLKQKKKHLEVNRKFVPEKIDKDIKRD